MSSKSHRTGKIVILLSIALCIASFFPVFDEYGIYVFILGAIMLVAGIVLAFVDTNYNRHIAKLDAAKQEREEARQQREMARERHRLRIAQTIETVNAIPDYEIDIAHKPVRRNTGFVPPDFSNITPKGNYSDIVVFDIETTGLKSGTDRIIELSAIRFLDRQAVAKFHTYINPDRPIPPESTDINGITDDMVVDSPKAGQIIESFDNFVGSSILVAHNLKFDLGFVYYAGSKVMDTKRKYIDTLEQSQRLLKKPDDVDNHKLSTLCDYFGITLAQAHQSIYDAYATGELFFRLVDMVQDN